MAEIQIDEKAIHEETVRKVVAKMTDNAYDRNSIAKKIEEQVAALAAKDYYEKNKLEILKAIDVDSVAKIATLQMFNHVLGTLRG